MPLREAFSQRNEIVEALVVPASNDTFRRAAAEIQPQEGGIVSHPCGFVIVWR